MNFQCTICKEWFDTLEDLKDHLKKALGLEKVR